MTVDIKQIDATTTGTSSTFATYISGLGGANRDIIISDNIDLGGASVTIPITVNIAHFDNGKKISNGSITINRMTADPLHQCFNTDVTVSFGNGAICHVRPEWFGAIPDGTTDSTTGLQKAMNQNDHIVILSKGTYKTSSSLTPLCSQIIGQGDAASVIKPSAAVTKAISSGNLDGSNKYPSVYKHFRIDGVDTVGATGLFLGFNGVASSLYVENVTIKNFTGTGAVGLRIGDCLKSMFVKCLCESNQIGVLFNENTTSFPTTIVMHQCVFNTNVDYGAEIITGYLISFVLCDFESNGKEGLLVYPAVGDASDISINECWFEDNQTSLGDPTTGYHCKINGSLANSRTAKVNINNSYFSGSISTCKAIHITGPYAAGCILHNPSVPDIADTILIDNGYGQVSAWGGATDYDTVVSDTDNLFTVPITAPDATSNAIPLFVDKKEIADSVMTQSTGLIGVGTSPSYFHPINVKTDDYIGLYLDRGATAEIGIQLGRKASAGANGAGAVLSAYPNGTSSYFRIFVNAVEQFRIKGDGTINIVTCAEHTDNTAAVTAGKSVGDIYRTGDALKIVH